MISTRRLTRSLVKKVYMFLITVSRDDYLGTRNQFPSRRVLIPLMASLSNVIFETFPKKVLWGDEVN
jgi:hypothetical protein